MSESTEEKDSQVKKEEKKNLKEFLILLFGTIKRLELEGIRFTKGKLLIFQIIAILSASIPFIISYINKLLIDEIVSILELNIDWQQSDLKMLVAMTVGVQVLNTGFGSITSFFDKDIYLTYSRYYSNKFLEKAASLDLYHYQDPESNKLINKARESYDHRLGETIWDVIWFIEALFTFLLSISIITSLSLPLVGLIILTTLPILYVNIKRANASWGIWDLNAVERMKYYESSHYLSREQSLVELKVFGTYKYLLSTVKSIYDSFTDKELKLNKKLTLADFFANLCVIIGQFVFMVSTISGIITGRLSVGDFTFYMSTADRLSNSLGTMFRRFSRLYEKSKYVNDFYKFMDLKNTIISGSKKLDLTSVPSIRFENVDFKYQGEDKYVLKNFNMEIKPGERIALVGENGAGKSTIIKLMTRFYDPTAGRILIDGVDIKELDMDLLYKKISMLTQDFARYGFLDVKTNVGLGDVDHVDEFEKIVDAAKKSGADKFIDTFKNKYDQILTKKLDEGTDLSGGQWQRVALARGFFKDAQVLILDEPTSAIDAKGEYEIFEKIYEFAKEKTVVIVSHRFSTVRMADKIYVIDGGQIVESGTHEELMKLDGKYAEAFNTQAKGYK